MSKTQLRIFTIESGRFEEFIDAWMAGVLPLRRRLGFHVEAWADREADLFVWFLRYEGEGTFEEADASYYASPERRSLEPDPAHWIARMETHWMEPIVDAR